MIPANAMVNRIGKVLYRRIDGAYKINFSPNTCDVYMFMYYQAPGEDMKQMNFDISITTYQNKLRINITEITTMEKTIGQLIYKPEQIKDDQEFFARVHRDIIKKIEHEYEDYDFVF